MIAIAPRMVAYIVYGFIGIIMLLIALGLFFPPAENSVTQANRDNPPVVSQRPILSFEDAQTELQNCTLSIATHRTSMPVPDAQQNVHFPYAFAAFSCPDQDGDFLASCREKFGKDDYHFGQCLDMSADIGRKALAAPFLCCDDGSGKPLAWYKNAIAQTQSTVGLASPLSAESESPSLTNGDSSPDFPNNTATDSEALLVNDLFQKDASRDIDSVKKVNAYRSCITHHIEIDDYGSLNLRGSPIEQLVMKCYNEAMGWVDACMSDKSVKKTRFGCATKAQQLAWAKRLKMTGTDH